MNIMQNNLKRQYELYASEYEAQALAVLRNGWYILGKEVTAFEEEWAAYIGAKHCVGLASGLDALWISFRLLGIGAGDEVIVSANAYVACVMGITMNGATPVFVEPDEYENIDGDKIEAAITSKTRAIVPVHYAGVACEMDTIMDIAKRHNLVVIEDAAQGVMKVVFVDIRPDTMNIDENLIEAAITSRTKAILAVHLFGQACDMSKVMDIARRHSLRVVEDCAQSHGNKWMGQTVGTFGDIGCFSFYPSKGCGAFGDAGAIVTNSDELDRRFRVFRNYGSEKRYYNEVVGTNSRLDELQAGLLRVKLRHLEEFNAERCRLAEKYSDKICSPHIIKPAVRPGADSTWHQYVIHSDKRDELIEYLKVSGIATLIHYPIPPHLSEAYAYLGKKPGDYPITERAANEVLSLPMYNGMTEEEQDYVIRIINGF